jgi:hypothetical protein
MSFGLNQQVAFMSAMPSSLVTHAAISQPAVDGTEHLVVLKPLLPVQFNKQNQYPMEILTFITFV